MIKLKHIILAALLMVSALPAMAATVTVDSITYEINSTSATLVDGSQRHDGVKLPSFVTYRSKLYPLTAIADSAFLDNTNIRSINIPQKVNYIGASAFDGCHNLYTVDFNNTDSTTIGEGAFRACWHLQAANLPDYVTSIGRYAFFNDYNMTSVHIPSGLTEIPTGAFYNCKKLTDVTLPLGLTTIGATAFEKCSGLVTCKIPKTVETFGMQCFNGCSSLEEIKIPTSTTSIGMSAFAGCYGLKKVFFVVRYESTTPSWKNRPIWPTISSNVFSDSTYNNATFYHNIHYTYSSSSPEPCQKFKNSEALNISCSGTVGYPDYYFSGSFRDGTLIYDIDDLTITLNDSNFPYFLSMPPTSCKLILKGNNVIQGLSDNVEQANPYRYGLYYNPTDENDSLIIEGPGSLSVKTQDYRPALYAACIKASGHVNIRKCSLDLNGQLGISNLNLTKDVNPLWLTIDSATVLAKGGSTYSSETEKVTYYPSICYLKGVTLNNCYLAEPEDAYLSEMDYRTGYGWCVWKYENGEKVIVHDQVKILPKAAPVTLKGDVNGDGKVDTSDLSELISIILNNGTATDYPRSDVNGDSKVDTTDISALMAIILGA